jgi:hypothetical protein
LVLLTFHGRSQECVEIEFFIHDHSLRFEGEATGRECVGLQS